MAQHYNVPDPHSTPQALAWWRGTDLDSMTRAAIERERLTVNAAIDAMYPHVPAPLVRRSYQIAVRLHVSGKGYSNG